MVGIVVLLLLAAILPGSQAQSPSPRTTNDYMSISREKLKEDTIWLELGQPVMKVRVEDNAPGSMQDILNRYFTHAPHDHESTERECSCNVVTLQSMELWIGAGVATLITLIIICLAIAIAFYRRSERASRETDERRSKENGAQTEAKKSG
ncbi:unnamed protein product, partial [Mesorhabditis spiculigera]